MNVATLRYLLLVPSAHCCGGELRSAPRDPTTGIYPAYESRRESFSFHFMMCRISEGGLWLMHHHHHTDNPNELFIAEEIRICLVE